MVLVSALGCATVPASAPHSMLGKRFELTLPSDRGEIGRVPVPGARAIVLDFFGPTCGPCAKSVPALVARRAELERGGVKLVLIAVLAEEETSDGARAALQTWAEMAGLDLDAVY